MNELKTHSRPKVGQLRSKPDVRTGVRTQLGTCLIASTDHPKRAMISVAATEAGWDTIVCAGANQAMDAVQRRHFQMAWVDVDVGPAPMAFRHLCEAVSSLAHVLLVVSGREDDAEEETWARRVGAWLYVPGLSPDCVSEISILCEQALIAAERAQDPS